MIFADQAHASPGSMTPFLFNGAGAGGLIFRPGVARIACGKASDSGGTCHSGGACSERAVLGTPWVEGLDKFCVWPPGQFGVSLQRLTEYQTREHRPFYNEIILDAGEWRRRLPHNVEAIFGNEAAHRQFLAAFAHDGVSAVTHPHLTFDGAKWQAPFS